VCDAPQVARARNTGGHAIRFGDRGFAAGLDGLLEADPRTAAEIAAALGVDRGTLKRWRQLENDPRLGDVIRLCRVLRVTMYQVAGPSATGLAGAPDAEEPPGSLLPPLDASPGKSDEAAPPVRRRRSA
jgi:transcriptional regulator with XRE-family HTH domain